MSRTLEIFEHGRLAISNEDAGLRPDEFDALVRFNDAHEGRYFEIGHRQLKAKGYVGYLQVANLAIAILPKADRDVALSDVAWREGLVEMLRVSLGLRLTSLPSSAQRITRSWFLDLIARAYLAEIAPLLREGLAKGYRTTQANGTVFRGRLKIAEHLRENITRADRFFVEYQTFDRDIELNRALVSALKVLAACALSSSVAIEVAACLARFPELPATNVTAE